MWNIFDNGNSIGEKGSEQGIIISDFENIFGARITIEKNGQVAPFSVTLGIYGVMFHTYFCSSENEAHKFRDKSIKKIDEVFEMLNVDEYKRDQLWNEKYYQKLDEMCEN